MGDNYNDEAAEFNSEDIEMIIKKCINEELSDKKFNTKEVNMWTNALVTNILRSLQGLGPYKYIITTIIMQKNGAGLNTSASMFWDAGKDGFCKIEWQNATMHCIITVYGLSVAIDDQQEEI